MKKKYANLLNKIKAGQTIKWEDFTTLMVHLGATVVERRGSRVVISLDGHKLNMHKPHPGNELLAYQLADARRFLDQCGQNQGGDA